MRSAKIGEKLRLRVFAISMQASLLRQMAHEQDVITRHAVRVQAFGVGKVPENEALAMAERLYFPVKEGWFDLSVCLQEIFYDDMVELLRPDEHESTEEELHSAPTVRITTHPKRLQQRSEQENSEW
jgi:hypothetical protein